MDYLVAVVGSRGLIEERIESHKEILIENGFLIVQHYTLELKPVEAQLLLGQSEDSIEAFTSGPCVAFLLKRTDAYVTFNSLRLELDYTYGSLTSWLALRDVAAFFPSMPSLERLLLIIKPGFDKNDAGNVYTEVMRLVQEYDFVVLAKEMKLVGVEAARKFATIAPPLADDDELTRLRIGQVAQKEVEYLTSDMSMVLILEKVGGIAEFSLLAGPSAPDAARLHAPHTLRARLTVPGGRGSSSSPYENLIYTSPSSNQAAKDIATFFPAPLPLERTCAIIKPDLLRQSESVARVLALVEDQGFTIVARTEVHMSKLRCEKHYGITASIGASLSASSANQASNDDNDSLTRYMSSGPSLVLLLSKPSAIESWLKLLGPSDPVLARESKPQSLRAKFGESRIRNALHGSANNLEAASDTNEFFPSISLDRIPGLVELQNLLATTSVPTRAKASPSKSVYDVLVDGLTQLCRVKPTGDEAVVYLAEWLLANNPNKPTIVSPEEVQVLGNLSAQLQGRAVLDATAASVTQPAQVDAPRPTAKGALNVTWIVGGPRSGKNLFARNVCRELTSGGGGGGGVEHIDVSSLLKSVPRSNTLHGTKILDLVANQRVVPASVLTPMLAAAIAGATSRNVVISAFPYSLDQSFEFEAAVGAEAINRLVVLQRGSSAAAAAASSGDDAIDAAKRKLFVEDIRPVIEHYQRFNKVTIIDVAIEDEEEVKKQIKKIVSK